MSVNRLLYRIGLGVIITGIVFYILQTYMSLDFFSFLPECYFHKYTGYFCFGCGSTRAVRELLKGHFLKSGYYNMNIPYLFLIFSYFMISYSTMIITKGKIQCMKIRPVHGYIVILISVIQFLIKNGILVFGCCKNVCFMKKECFERRR